MREAATSTLCCATRPPPGVTMTTTLSLVCREDERATGSCGREGEGEGGRVDAAAGPEQREVRGLPGAGGGARGRGGGRRALPGGAREAARPHGH
jgi:hypothetical protein